MLHRPIEIAGRSSRQPVSRLLGINSCNRLKADAQQLKGAKTQQGQNSPIINIVNGARIRFLPPSHRLADEDRDVSGRALTVVGVRGVVLVADGPEVGLLVGDGKAGV